MRLFLPLFRLSWLMQSLLIYGAFLLVGTAVMDDYGPSIDAPGDRRIAARNLAFITGAADRLDGFPFKHDKYYGTAFHLPLLLLERGLGLEDSRRIYLLRHLVTHAFFLVGGLCCSLLVYRLTRSRAVALFTLLVFVLQPRLYAHSFFNGKDLPFLSMFMVTLYVTHRAFRRDTVGAFVLCGMCVGILTNLRIMGVMLYPAVLALRGLDLVQARRGEGAHVLVTGAVFALAGLGTLYVLSPYLWADPFEFITAWQVLSHHPHTPSSGVLFQGQRIGPGSLPAHYIPTWVAISTPLVTLGAASWAGIVVGVRSIRRPRVAVGNTDLRFGLLLVGCLTLPVVAIIALDSRTFDEWRHVYFLHAPLCGLAGLGLAWVGGRSRWAAAGVAALAAAGVLVTGMDMVQLHPHQQVYFNALVDRTTPEALRTRYTLDSWSNSCRRGLEFLRRRYPATTVYVQGHWPVILGWWTLPQADRARLVLLDKDDGTADFDISCGSQLQKRLWRGWRLPENVVYRHKAYNNTLLRVAEWVTVPDRQQSVARRVESTYRGATAGELLSEGRFDVYTYPGSRLLGYARETCTVADVKPWFFVHVFPVDEQQLPSWRSQYGFDNPDFSFVERGKQVGGKCWATVELPAYEIARIRTGQYDERGELWETELVGPIR